MTSFAPTGRQLPRCPPAAKKLWHPKTLRRKQKSQSGDWLDCLVLLVRPERFERPTPWFVAKYSIQLSYG
ncbi:MAG: hypothetical protein WAV95_11295, partial [Azonexus sp.]